MARTKIEIGSYYRLRGNPMGWAKPIRIIQPRTGANTHDYPIAECEWTIGKGNTFGLIKYFKLSNLVPESK